MASIRLLLLFSRYSTNTYITHHPQWDFFMWCVLIRLQIKTFAMDYQKLVQMGYVPHVVKQALLLYDNDDTDNTKAIAYVLHPSLFHRPLCPSLPVYWGC